MIGEKLIAAGIITQAQLDESLEEQKSSGRKIGEILVMKGYATQAQVDEALK